MRFLFAFAFPLMLPALIGCGTSATHRSTTALAGTYRFHKVTFLDRVAYPDDKDDLEMVIEGETMTFTGKGWNKTSPVHIKVDPSKTPAAIDMLHRSDGKEELVRGIYKLEADELMIAAGPVGGEENRPKDFTPRRDVMIEVYKRKSH